MTMWKDMTDCEKGALLLAHQRGETIEYLSNVKGRWCLTAGNPDWFDTDTYRVKPAEPVHRTTSQDVWCHGRYNKYPVLLNYGSHEFNAYLGKLTQVYRDDVLVEFTWRADDA